MSLTERLAAECDDEALYTESFTYVLQLRALAQMLRVDTDKDKILAMMAAIDTPFTQRLAWDLENYAKDNCAFQRLAEKAELAI